MQKQRDLVLTDLHTVNLGKQSFIELDRHVKSKKLKAKEFRRLYQIKHFYHIFKTWSDWNRLNSRREYTVIKEFRQRLIFKHWLRHLEK